MVLLALFSWQSSLGDYEVETHQVGDDQWVQVDLPFNFPFYGQVFGTSFMFTNGVIGFINPTEIAGTGIVNDGLCCNAFDFTQTNNNYGSHGAVRFNYLIAPWHTDLIDHPNSNGVMMTQGGCDTVDSCYQSYFWENISEYYDNTDLNTFSTTIEPLGSILFNYTKVDVQSHSVSVFVSGDFSNSNEYEQWYYNHPTNGGVYWNSDDEEPINVPETMSICEVAPDASLACLYRPSTWADAYYNQQCGISSLYDTGCSGYETAYYNQQCGITALYDPTCNGYEEAWILNQCTYDELYHPTCPNYATNYAEWLSEQYTESEDEGYGAYNDDFDEIEVFEPEIIYLEPEILEISVLPDVVDTFAPVNINEIQLNMPTFDDIVIAEVEAEIESFFAEMDFEELPNLELPDMQLEPMEELPNVIIDETTEETTESISTETQEEEVLLNEPNVEQSEEETQEDTRTTNEENTEESTEEQNEEEPVEDEPVEQDEADEEKSESEEQEDEPSDTDDATEKTEEKEVVMVAKTEPKKMTAKQKQKAKEKKMREIIADKLKNLAIEVGEASTIEAQTQLQNIIIALLGYNQGFSTYNTQLTDANFYESKVIYDIRLPDSLRGRRIGLASELLHKKMVDIQWEESYGRKTN
mgnify:CR=1 FL=1